MTKLTQLVLAAALACAAMSGETLWIDRNEARLWHDELAAAALASGLSIGLVAELIGQESGFQNIGNPHSTAHGFGQQIKRNRIMEKHDLDRTLPGESILGAALELKENLRRTGSLESALDAYGTTHGLGTVKRRLIVGRMERAARRFE